MKTDLERRSPDMAGLTNEMLLYGGIAVAAAAVIGLIVFICVMKVKKIRLNTQLNAEYGEMNG